MNVLILEASTSSAKAMLYSAKQGVLRVETVPCPTEVGGADTHRMESLFAQLMAVGKRVAAGHTVACIALVGSWHTLVLTDDALKPICPSFTWASPAGGEIARRIRQDRDTAHLIYRTTGCMPNATYLLYKFLQLKKDGKLPESFLVMDESAYLFYRLTGVWGTSRPAVAGTSMLNIHILDWDGMILDKMGVRRAQLPELHGHEMTFPLHGEAAALLGVPTGTPVAMPEPDGAMNQLGAGAMKKGAMTLSIGTSAAMRLIHDGPLFIPGYANWCYYAPGTHISGCATAGSTNCVDWFRKTMGGNLSFSKLETGACIREDTPHFLPFLFGERCPGWEDGRTASFSGLQSKHDLHDLYAAVLEGILHNVYDCYSSLTAQCGEPETILLSGGILKSPWWTQLLADVFQREIIASEVDQVSLLGGAAIALHSIGLLKDLADFSPCVEDRIIAPREETVELVEKRFRKYRKLYLSNSD